MATVIDIDAREDHPTIIFFTDRATGYTIAAEKETGRVIGCAAPNGWRNGWPNSDAGLTDVLWTAVRQYERTMMDGKTCEEYYKQER